MGCDDGRLSRRARTDIQKLMYVKLVTDYSVHLYARTATSVKRHPWQEEYLNVSNSGVLLHSRDARRGTPALIDH